MRRAASFLPRQVVGTITNVATDKPVVALTFDDGPDPRSTPPLLDVLESKGAHATFFLIGCRAQRYPALVQRIIDRGHVIGCHSWDHRPFLAISAAERRRQLRACEQLPGMTRYRLFRPPYGEQNLASRIDTWRLRWCPIVWSISATDWRDDSAEVIVERVASQLQPGSIVLLHDSLYDVEEPRYEARDATIQATAQLLERFSGQYRFVTVPELMHLGRPQREFWWRRGSKEYFTKLIKTEYRQGEANE
ncbi:MAG: polysaccharide deacetylase family protein [Gammaproteobacteria bacterium]|nr:polysaccharide deacetylase family protein [Gammaproteobacteria bacterium]